MKQTLFEVLRKLSAAMYGTGISTLPGMLPLYNWIYRLLNPNKLMLIDAQGSKMYVDTRDTLISYALFAAGAMEPEETEFLKGLLQPGMTFVDVGANIGYYSLLAARLVGEGGKVYAFEPEPDTFGLLLKNIEVNHYPNIVPIQKAVSNQMGQTLLFQDRATRGGMSLSPNNPLERIGSVAVETITLDEFFKNGAAPAQVDVIKMDIQGAEGLAIAGATNLLGAEHLKIVMEFWPFGLRNLNTEPVSVLRTFQKFGFRIHILFEYGMHLARTRPVGKQLEPDEFDKLVASCEKKSNYGGRAFVNLYLEK